NEQQHKRTIGRTFAVAAKPVTLGQYREFRPSYDGRAPTDDCPANVTWYQAAEYFNWLSAREGIKDEQWCYETDATGRVTKLKANYLSREGYRLPTEAEWEYACRAGAVTSRYFGESEELLGHYGWFVENARDHSWPVGEKKPNDLGLFDMYGNAWCWCQESFHDYPAGGEPV